MLLYIMNNSIYYIIEYLTEAWYKISESLKSAISKFLWIKCLSMCKHHHSSNISILISIPGFSKDDKFI